MTTVWTYIIMTVVLGVLVLICYGLAKIIRRCSDSIWIIFWKYHSCLLIIYPLTMADSCFLSLYSDAQRRHTRLSPWRWWLRRYCLWILLAMLWKLKACSFWPNTCLRRKGLSSSWLTCSYQFHISDWRRTRRGWTRRRHSGGRCWGSNSCNPSGLRGFWQAAVDFHLFFSQLLWQRLWRTQLPNMASCQYCAILSPFVSILLLPFNSPADRRRPPTCTEMEILLSAQFPPLNKAK